jgi:hypothetical protein
LEGKGKGMAEETIAYIWDEKKKKHRRVSKKQAEKHEKKKEMEEFYKNTPAYKYGFQNLTNEYTWYCDCDYEITFWESHPIMGEEDQLYLYDNEDSEGWSCDCETIEDEMECKCFDGMSREEYYGESSEEIMKIKPTREYIEKLNTGICMACDKAFYEQCRDEGNIKYQVERYKKYPYQKK